MISVIVPTYNREECLIQMLQSLKLQTYEDFEILVIDQSETVSDLKIKQVMECCNNIKYYRTASKGRSMSKNLGIDLAGGDIILFCDDDIVADRNFLMEHFQLHLKYPVVGAISCHLIEPHEKEIVYKRAPLKITYYGRFINKPNAIFNGYVTSLNGGNMSFKRSAITKAGYFDENLIGTSMLEEPDIAIRLQKLGFKLFFSANTKVLHYPQYNGNISTQKNKRYQWLKDYYYNQYYFMFRNKRQIYFPLIFSYLIYRTIVEAVKNKTLAIRFLMLPVSAFLLASIGWKNAKGDYIKPWHTCRKNKIDVIKSITN